MIQWLAAHTMLFLPSYSGMRMHTAHLVPSYSVFFFLSLFTLNFSDVFIVHHSNLAPKAEWLFNSTCQHIALESSTNTNCAIFLIFLWDTAAKLPPFHGQGIEAHKKYGKRHELISETQSEPFRTCSPRMFSIVQHFMCSNGNFGCSCECSVFLQEPQGRSSERGRHEARVQK